MKRIITGTLFTIILLGTCQSQNLDLIVTTGGDSIACKIDSMTTDKVNITTLRDDIVIKTSVGLQDVLKYEFNVIEVRRIIRIPGSIYIRTIKPKPAKEKNRTINIQDDFPKNTIYGSAGTLLVYLTANGNYERHILTKEGKRLTRYLLHFGYGGSYEWGEYYRTTVLSLNWFSGREKSHLELGLGIIFWFNKSEYDVGVDVANYFNDPKPTRWNYRSIVPAATIGYRYQKPSRGFVFRTGIAIPDAAYVSLGYAF